jgi:hypothetical protein
MSKKLQLAFSERRIRKGIYRMYARLRPYHLIGAIGGFLTVLTAIISLAVSTSYYISAEWVIIVNMLLIGSNGLIATYFFGAFSASRDSLIKVGSAPLPELMDRKKRDIMERKGDKEDENKRQKQQKESSAAAL